MVGFAALLAPTLSFGIPAAFNYLGLLSAGQTIISSGAVYTTYAFVYPYFAEENTRPETPYTYYGVNTWDPVDVINQKAAKIFGSLVPLDKAERDQWRAHREQAGSRDDDELTKAWEYFEILTNPYLRCEYHLKAGLPDWYGVPDATICAGEWAVQRLEGVRQEIYDSHQVVYFLPVQQATEKFPALVALIKETQKLVLTQDASSQVWWRITKVIADLEKYQEHEELSSEEAQASNWFASATTKMSSAKSKTFDWFADKFHSEAPDLPFDEEWHVVPDDEIPGNTKTSGWFSNWFHSEVAGVKEEPLIIPDDVPEVETKTTGWFSDFFTGEASDVEDEFSLISDDIREPPKIVTEKPVPITSEEPSPIVSEEPSSIIPEDVSSAVYDEESTSVVSEEPLSIASKEPSPITTEEQSPIVSEEPSEPIVVPEEVISPGRRNESFFVRVITSYVESIISFFTFILSCIWAPIRYFFEDTFVYRSAASTGQFVWTNLKKGVLEALEDPNLFADWRDTRYRRYRRKGTLPLLSKLKKHILRIPKMIPTLKVRRPLFRVLKPSALYRRSGLAHFWAAAGQLFQNPKTIRLKKSPTVFAKLCSVLPKLLLALSPYKLPYNKARRRRDWFSAALKGFWSDGTASGSTATRAAALFTAGGTATVAAPNIGAGGRRTKLKIQ